MLSTSASLIWVSVVNSRQKAEAHTVTLPGRRAVLQHCSGKSQHRSTSVFLLASSVSATSMTQEAMQMSCALSFPPALLAPLAQATPCMEKARRLKYRQFQLQHPKALGGIGKPLPSSNPLYSLSLASSQHPLLTAGGAPPLHLLPITAQKAFFLCEFLFWRL